MFFYLCTCTSSHGCQSTKKGVEVLDESGSLKEFANELHPCHEKIMTGIGLASVLINNVPLVASGCNRGNVRSRRVWGVRLKSKIMSKAT